jgi:uncharacterized membrane protein (DUF373 family)
VSFQEKFWQGFDLWILRVLQVMLAIGIVAALATMFVLMIQGILTLHERIDTVPELQRSVQMLFAGVLLVVLGLELMDTLRNYFIEHRLRVEFLISVALIAVARHVIQIDYEHASAMTIAAMAALLLALAGGYVMIRRFGRS